MSDALDKKLSIYDYIIILCPTFYVNNTYTEWKTDWCGVSPNKLEEVIDYIIKGFSKSGKDETKTLIMINDMRSGSERHQNFSKLIYLAYSRRHYGM